MSLQTRSLELVRSSKLNPGGQRWYRYYAGYSPEFVSDICDAFSTGDKWSTLDPWMGSGTTLSVAAARGSVVAGLDLNPAMVVVARGRLLTKDTLDSVETLGADVLRYWRSATLPDSEPLRHWFSAETAQLLRGLAKRIHKVLVDDSDSSSAAEFSSLASFFYVALFETVTAAVRSYSSRNPTWIKRASNYEGSVSMTREQVAQSFTQSVKRLAFHIRSTASIDLESHDAASLHLGDSRAMPFEESSFDAVISSPPYLTRLDYVMGHAPELAVLGLDGQDIRALRDGMIGTPTRTKEETDEAFGRTAEDILKKIGEHDSYAAKSYYEPNARQYFAGMAASFREIERVVKPGGDVVLVVQDSFFKDVRIDLASAMRDMGVARGWTFGAQKNFTNIRSMAQLNKSAHKIAQSTKPTESVITFRTSIQQRGQIEDA